MLLFVDTLTGDEMFSDAFKVYVSICHSDLYSGCLMLIYKRKFRKAIDDVAYEVDCAMVTVKPGADIDIGTVDPQDEYRDLLLILDRR